MKEKDKRGRTGQDSTFGSNRTNRRPRRTKMATEKIKNNKKKIVARKEGKKTNKKARNSFLGF